MNKFRLGKKWLYIPLVAMAIFYLIPMYVMLVTGFKSFAEVDLQTMWNLPKGYILIITLKPILNWLPPSGTVSSW